MFLKFKINSYVAISLIAEYVCAQRSLFCSLAADDEDSAAMERLIWYVSYAE